MWTHFMDMHSGGGRKLAWEHIFIEAPEHEAELIFQNRFDRNPHRVTCTCCGDDYWVSEEESLEQATAYQRNCEYVYVNEAGEEMPSDMAWTPGKGVAPGFHGMYVERSSRYGKHVPLADYLKREDVLVIRADEIKSAELRGSLREEGYVWR